MASLFHHNPQGINGSLHWGYSSRLAGRNHLIDNLNWTKSEFVFHKRYICPSSTLFLPCWCDAVPCVPWERWFPFVRSLPWGGINSSQPPPPVDRLSRAIKIATTQPHSKEVQARDWIHFQTMETWSGAEGRDAGDGYMARSSLVLFEDGWVSVPMTLPAWQFIFILTGKAQLKRQIYLLKHL